MSPWIRNVRSAFLGIGAAGAALSLAGCAGGLPGAWVDGPGFDAVNGTRGQSAAEQGKPRSVQELRQAHLDKPSDPDATVAYARGLKSSGRAKEALAVVEAAAGANPDNRQLVIEQGFLALELGHTQKAQHALLRAAPDSRDWRVLSGLGVAHAGAGQHAKAQDYFNRALVLSPNNPSVLNNLALSYILDEKVEKGRELLEQASLAASGIGDKPQIARNLELAMALPSGSKPKPTAPRPSPTAGSGSVKPAAATAAVKPAPSGASPVTDPAVEPPISPPVDPATRAQPAAALPAAATPPAPVGPVTNPPPPTAAAGSVAKAALEPVEPNVLNRGMLTLGSALAQR